MNLPIESIQSIQILRDRGGYPAFAVIPYVQYEALVRHTPKAEPGIPNEVVHAFFDDGLSVARAWREYLELTQEEVAKRMGITQGAYAQLEGKQKIRKSSREKIARALGIDPTQLDF